ncbi:MAG: hypothetical protein ACTSO2_19680, partial [Promethearchaeota archaeon]
IVPHEHLKEAIMHQREHYTQGRYAILSKNFLKKYDLLRHQKEILSAEMLQSILNETIETDDIIKLYKTANSAQKETIVKILVDKLIDEPTGLSAYLVSRFNRDCKIDLEQKANENRVYLAYLKERSVSRENS